MWFCVFSSCALLWRGFFWGSLRWKESASAGNKLSALQLQYGGAWIFWVVGMAFNFLTLLH
jgi:hypothetical protein